MRRDDSEDFSSSQAITGKPNLTKPNLVDRKVSIGTAGTSRRYLYWLQITCRRIFTIPTVYFQSTLNHENQTTATMVLIERDD